MPRRSLTQLWQAEFAHYDRDTLRADFAAGLNVAAVALPLALAFGVASGHTAAAGLVSAIVAGVVIGVLQGAPYQISGPTGAMSAVLISLIASYGLDGMWTAVLVSGLLTLGIGLLRLGRFIAFVPAPVATGFTSGIAIVIAIGQLDALLGVHTPSASAPLMKLIGYGQTGITPDWHAIAIAVSVMALMLAWPPRWQARLPGSLVAIVGASLIGAVAGWPLATIGKVPATVFLSEHFSLPAFRIDLLADLMPSALSLTALSALVSLLCGSAASNATGVRLQANQELVAQGVGNLILPFFGAVPATGAVARTMVGIRSGGRTRLVSLIHSLLLLAVLLLAGPLLAQVPLAALAGVLLVTVWRMNDWPAIRYMFRHGFRTAIATFTLTVAAMTVFNVTQVVLLGVFLSGAIFLNQIANLEVDVQAIDPAKLRARGLHLSRGLDEVRVAYLTGPLFFAAAGAFNEAFAHLHGAQVLILSMRGVPLVDLTGVRVIGALHARLAAIGGTLMLAGVHPNVYATLVRGGLIDAVGEHNVFWSTDQALLEIDRRQT
jgi:SulP family sulfate permease